MHLNSFAYRQKMNGVMDIANKNLKNSSKNGCHL